MVGIIFGSVWGVICFILGCVLTYIVCKHYEGIAVEARVKSMPPPKTVYKPLGTMDPILPKVMNRSSEIEFEGDDDDED